MTVLATTTATPTPTPMPTLFPSTPTPVFGWMHASDIEMNATSFVPGDIMELDAHIVPCTNCDNPIADAYIAVLTPDNNLYFLTPGLGFTTAPTRIASHIKMQEEIIRHIATFLMGDVAPGDYFWFAVLTKPNKDVLNSGN